jgi:hypothetical protein
MVRCFIFQVRTLVPAQNSFLSFLYSNERPYFGNEVFCFGIVGNANCSPQVPLFGVTQ